MNTPTPDPLLLTEPEIERISFSDLQRSGRLSFVTAFKLKEQARTAIKLKEENDALRKELEQRNTSLKFIATFGGKHIDGVSCNGSWAAEQARCSLPQEELESIAQWRKVTGGGE